MKDLYYQRNLRGIHFFSTLPPFFSNPVLFSTLLPHFFQFKAFDGWKLLFLFGAALSYVYVLLLFDVVQLDLWYFRHDEFMRIDEQKAHTSWCSQSPTIFSVFAPSQLWVGPSAMTNTTMSPSNCFFPAKNSWKYVTVNITINQSTQPVIDNIYIYIYLLLYIYAQIYTAYSYIGVS